MSPFTVWNPSYSRDAMMYQHLKVLLDWDDRWARGEVEPDDIYVWWGSPDRRWFDDRDILIDRRLWAEKDAEMQGERPSGSPARSVVG